MADTYKRLRNDGQYDDIEWRELLHTLDANGYAVAASATNPMPVTGGSISGVPQTLPTITALGATRVSVTFSPPVKSVVVNVRFGAATPDNDEIVAIVFGAPNDATADAWLDPAGTGPRKYIKPGDGPQEFSFTSATVSRVDLQGQGTTPDLDVVLEGVS